MKNKQTFVKKGDIAYHRMTGKGPGLVLWVGNILISSFNQDETFCTVMFSGEDIEIFVLDEMTSLIPKDKKSV
jgi:hypothetical protein